MEKKQIKEMVAQEMEQIRQWCSLLECHLVEVVSKWQEQVGYQSEHLKVYYSNERDSLSGIRYGAGEN